MKFKKAMIIFTVVLMIMGLSVTAFAIDTKETDTASKVAQWKESRLERMQERLNSLVSAGKITREQANTMLEAIKQRQADCDGTGGGFGGGRGQGKGNGNGNGMGMGRFGNLNGTCPFAADGE